MRLKIRYVAFESLIRLANYLAQHQLAQKFTKDNQKKIIIGKSGSMIKKIGIESRLKLELIHGKQFYISLKVLVKENWKNNYILLKEIGYID